MLHAKTAVADGRWARVGSTNLNIASWMGNRELDVIDRGRGDRRADGGRCSRTTSATPPRSCSTGATASAPPGRRRAVRSRSGSGGRVMAGAARIGNTVTAAITNRRVLEPVEAHITLIRGPVAWRSRRPRLRLSAWHQLSDRRHRGLVVPRIAVSRVRGSAGAESIGRAGPEVAELGTARWNRSMICPPVWRRRIDAE